MTDTPFFVIGRNVWGARKPRHTPTKDNWSNGVDVIVHHTADTPPPAKGVTVHVKWLERRYMRKVQNQHMDVNQWDDIGYSYVIMPSGRVYEGRGYEVRGAHVENQNTDKVGISFAGNFSNHVPTAAAVAAYKKLRTNLRDHGATLRATRGHGDLMATSCPGHGIRLALDLPQR